MYNINTALNKFIGWLIKEQLLGNFRFIHQHNLFQEWYIHSKTSLTFRCLFCRMISLWLENTLQFRQSLLHWGQISFPGAVYLGLQTGSSCWESDPENMVDGAAIQSAICAILLLLRSTCDMVHCFGERALFSYSFGVVFSQFLSTNAPITPYNIRFWWFFLSQGNRWIKYRAHPKIWRPKPYQLKLAFLVALDGFHPLLSTQLTADLTLKCNNGSMFHSMSHTVWKYPFYCTETAPKSALNRRRVVVYDRLWANAPPISNRAFSCSNAHAKWWIHCFLIHQVYK